MLREDRTECRKTECNDRVLYEGVRLVKGTSYSPCRVDDNVRNLHIQNGTINEIRGDVPFSGTQHEIDLRNTGEPHLL